MLTRREFLEVAGVGAAALLVPGGRARAAAPIDGGALEKYVDPLPVPGVLSPTTPGGRHYRVEISEFSQQLHRDLPNPTTVWGVQRLVPWPDVRGSQEQADHGRVGQQSPFGAQTPAPAGHDDRRIAAGSSSCPRRPPPTRRPHPVGVGRDTGCLVRPARFLAHDGPWVFRNDI